MTLCISKLRVLYVSAVTTNVGIDAIPECSSYEGSKVKVHFREMGMKIIAAMLG